MASVESLALTLSLFYSQMYVQLLISSGQDCDAPGAYCAQDKNTLNPKTLTLNFLDITLNFTRSFFKNKSQA